MTKLVESLTVETAEKLLKEARLQRTRLSKIPILEIVETLVSVGQLWRPGGEFYKRALELLPEELSFSRETIEFSLKILPEILSQKNLLERLRSDFDNIEVLDGFSQKANFGGRVRFVPHGILLHVSAGNVFLGAVDSLILGFLTKNFSIMKLSSSNQEFPELFAQSILAADKKGILAPSFRLVHWKGGTQAIESLFKTQVDAIVAWGGEGMAQSYRHGLGPGVVLLEHGPKLSFQVITKKGLEGQNLTRVAKQVARDISLWDQAACASPQNLFVENGIQLKDLLNAIAQALDEESLPLGRLGADEVVEILKEEHRGKVTEVSGGILQKGKEWLLHFDPRPGIRPSPLNRTLIVKSFAGIDDLLRQLKPAQRVLQSCSYLLDIGERDLYLNLLSEFGVLRFARLGTVMDGLIGAPHDGRLSLVELGKLIPDESKAAVLDFVKETVRGNQYYKDLYKGSEPTSIENLIPLQSFDLPLTHRDQKGGYVFSSGGTSGKAKYVFFTSDEFDRVSKMLALGFQAQNLKPGDVCANLFVAGNLWSSFLAVEKALTECEAVQLPIGGLAEPQLILQYLEQFRPRAVFGLPSLLIDLARKSLHSKSNIQIEKVFYAGEHLTEQGRQLLSRSWGVREFHSAGYASVDAGPIGYQCSFSRPREHHLFENDVHLEILNGEGYVTSLVRKSMPVIHLRTGDHLEWVTDSKPCPCGSVARRFILHGRIDGQMRIWSSRVLYEEIETAFQNSGVTAPLFQTTLEETQGNTETMKIRFESIETPTDEVLEKLKRALYEACKDLKATHPFDYLKGKLVVESLKPGALPRVPRTGKIKPIIDNRKI